MPQKKNVYLFQPQYARVHLDRMTYWIPYSAGSIWSYAQQNSEVNDNYQLADLIYRREDPTDLVNRLDNPEVCGFSCYVWNANYSLHVAKMIKKKWPNCLILFGGPQANSKMMKHKFIDSIIVAEGEEAFTEILIRRHHNKSIDRIFKRPRLLDLDIPSPYVDGIFDKIIKEAPDADWCMVLETNRGCPFACTFCNWGSVTHSKVKKFGMERVKAELDWIAENPIVFIFPADANFGIFKERDLEIAKMIKHVAEVGQLKKVNFQYTKNSTEHVFEIAKELIEVENSVTISVQSMNPPTLEAVKRKNMDINNIENILAISKTHDISTYTELILGLPLETLETWSQGMCQLLELGQHDNMRIYFCQILDNSELDEPSEIQKYGIKTVVAEDFLGGFANDIDYTDITEEIRLINETNTMTTDDLIDAFMFGWMISVFHNNGYTQLIAKYCRNIHNIQYYDFYSNLLEIIQTDPIFNELYIKVKEDVTQYLTTGKMSSGNNGFSWYMFRESFHTVYTNHEGTIALAKQVVKNLTGTDINESLINMQHKLCYRAEESYPLIVTSDLISKPGIKSKQRTKLIQMLLRKLRMISG